MGPWLDDLSEDWVSEPRSSPGGSLPNGTPERPANTDGPNTTLFVSRIPRLRGLGKSTDANGAARAPGLKPVREKPEDETDHSGVLNERSVSSINITIPIPGSNRPAKIFEDDHRGRRLSRTVSASTICATVHQTVQKSHSASPQKGYETPEWKRRLLGGDVGYGDKRDLFSPMGLENIFRPPPQQNNRASPIAARQEKSYMPSSPPGRKPIEVDDSFFPADEGSDANALGDTAEVNEDSLDYPGPYTAQRQPREGGFRISSFGEGQLDTYEFREYSFASSRPEDFDEDAENKPPMPELKPGSQTRFPFRQPSVITEDSSDAQPPIFTQATVQVIQETTSRRKNTTVQHDTEKVNVTKSLRRRLSHSRTRAELQSGMGENNGLDAPFSPVKDRTPKRRRTLHKDDSEMSFSKDVPAAVSEKSHQIPSIIGKKRKDAKYEEDSNEILSPEIVALRQILRPRTPTPSQSKVLRKQQTPRSAEEHNPSSPRRRTGHHNNENRTEAHAATAAVRAATDKLAAMGIGQQVISESRKGSVTTQEFLDEAMMVMRMIRAKGKLPGSGLASVEESDSDGDKAKTPDMVQAGFGDESTREEFERPPSRENNIGTGPRGRLAVSQDPRVVSHLRKFEDTTNVEDISTSLRSLNILKSRTAAEDAVQNAPEPEEEIVSDPPNIRIIEGPEHQQRKRKYSSSTAPSQREQPRDSADQIEPQSSSSAVDSAGNRSVPTTSSTRSDTVLVIAPQAVQHLIPDNIAGMVFDKDKKIWVKQSQNQNHERSGSEFSDDPFKEISDLPVNEHEEMERIKLTTSRPQTANTLGDEVMENKEEHDVQAQDSRGDYDARQREAREMANSSSPQSKYSRLASSGPKTETRATSWGESVPGDFMESRRQRQETHTTTWKSTEEEHIEEVEHEIQVHEDRVDSEFDPSGNNQRRRGLHIAFSSPLVSLRHHDVGNSPQPEAEIWEDPSGIEYEDSAIGELQDIEQSFQENTPQRKSVEIPTKTGYRGAARRMSLGGRSFSSRLVSRIEEQNEDSVIIRREQGNADRCTSLGVACSTPMPLKDLPGSSSMPPPTTGRRMNVSFHLSPLSDFTANPVRTAQELEYSYVAQRRGDVSVTGIDCSFSVATVELVKRLTDVEPYEPYWEYIRSLELKRKNLMTLHGLENFCSRIEELDVSDNEIGQLSGVPTGIRHLKISHNCLSSLTAWGHLTNLQYLDISGNEIDSLQGFAKLVHLRELKADDNEIKSLEGIHRLDGLISLSARRNRLEKVDFENSDLRRLQELDLRGNRIEAVKNLQRLTALVHLNLDDNNLGDLTVHAPNLLPTLNTLKLSSNKLRTLDITPFPELKLLYLDRNRLGRIEGLANARHLDSLSMREQEWKTGSSASLNIDDAYEVRKLYLSGNVFPTFEPKLPFLNLQYLELANAGLATLPANFGKMVPNLRVLNLNSNALKDIRPVQGITRLKKLLLAGNRLSRLRKTTNVLAKFQTLSKLDIRNNPLTVGFYPSVTEGRLVRNITPADVPANAAADPFSLLEADEEADAAYKGRLDMDTKLKRRTYEMLLGFGCSSLKELDGLPLDREVVLTRDECWAKLRELGILKYLGDGEDEEGVEKLGDVESAEQEVEGGEKLAESKEVEVTEKPLRENEVEFEAGGAETLPTKEKELIEETSEVPPSGAGTVGTTNLPLEIDLPADKDNVE